MSTLIEDFRRECADAKVSPAAVLKEAGIHPSLWWKWRSAKVSPTLKNFEAAKAKLEEIIARGGDAQ